MLFIEYSKCSTCKKAKEWLETNKISYTDRHIVDNNPTYEEISDWVKKYDIGLSKLFNTSGIKYREMNLKDKLVTMSDDDKIKLLATDGMLVKRPLVVSDDKILIGFKIKEWEEYFNNR